jgi:hypothetical protein
MHITHAYGRIMSSRWRLTAVTLLAAVCASAALAIGASAPASAAGPYYLQPDQRAAFPTWVWGSTRVCVTNSTYRAGMADVVPRWSSPPGQHDEMYVPAYTTNCIDRWWGGVTIDVTNTSRKLGSYIGLRVWSQ